MKVGQFKQLSVLTGTYLGFLIFPTKLSTGYVENHDRASNSLIDVQRVLHKRNIEVECRIIDDPLSGEQRWLPCSNP